MCWSSQNTGQQLGTLWLMHASSDGPPCIWPYLNTWAHIEQAIFVPTYMCIEQTYLSARYAVGGHSHHEVMCLQSASSLSHQFSSNAMCFVRAELELPSYTLR